MKGLGLLVLGAVMLAGCSDEADTALAAETATNAWDGLPAEYAENPQVTDDRELTVMGDAIIDEKGTLTLENINTEPVRKTIGPLTLTIRESKLMHYQPDSSLKDFYQSYTHDSDFYLVKLTVEFTNLSAEPVKFWPAETVLTSGGELKTREDDVYSENLNEPIQSGETKAGSIGFIVKNAGFESLAITTSDLLDQQGELIIPGDIISINFAVR
ncbi:hypothetical protein B0X71_08485 [Planococcus lenghuensis]|uniref:DUF4352 domain-containing protein n=2 Tax=Planococcus lenghuensis TaxID=2213202 RepID=A0A1Q2KY36_9BACL|nr:hypothetical protein B0X71_08485 [Planococcus lenghuensis]